MMMKMCRSWACLASLVLLAANGASSAPTWPASSDELEDIMFLNTGYRAKGFSTAVTPCGFSAHGPGRNAAAEWIRTAFHDMSTGSSFTHVGGLDASLMYELNSGENLGDGFATTFTTFAPFLTSRSSMADIVALGVYTAVRACGGPIIPIKTGRKDATSGGAVGVPQPQNDIGTFANQFLRMGFNQSEMIAVTACGHTVGGVHASFFPQIVTAGSVPNDYALFDTTSGEGTANFDEKIASEYVAGASIDALVSGPSVASGRNSDKKVFAADGNVTIGQLADPATFQSTCRTVLQKMIELVPSSVTLTDPIVVYEVKPYALQLTLLGDGSSIRFTGDIRVRTTSRTVSKVQLSYKDRTGASAGTVDTTSSGTAAGFDDSFGFFGFSVQLASSTSISSFAVLVTLGDGTTQTFDNNGAGFPVQDRIMLQKPQSCLSSTADANGQRNITVLAAVRNTETATPTLNLTLRAPRTLPQSLLVPTLRASSVPMSQSSTVGPYNIYKASYLAVADQAASAKFDVIVGTASDSFKDAGDLGTVCGTFDEGTSTATPSSTSSSVPPTTTSTLTEATPTSSSATSSTAAPTATTISYLGCFTDSVSARAFTGASTVNSALTVEKCASFCSLFQYFGVEYGTECYCGNTRGSGSTKVSDSDCSMACGGDSGEKCGAGDRLSVYENLLYSPIVEPEIAGYTYMGCYNDTVAGRVLSGSYTSSSSMTVASCASFCSGSAYFGLEYGAECYCGATLASSSTKQPESDCSMHCSGNAAQFCGAGDRLTLYSKSSS